MRCLLAFLLSASALLAADPAELPKCPPDWKVELVAEVPTLQHPSVVCCAPDGRIFVGEDPMDMGNDSKVPTDRILCFHPGGKVTVFADKLHAVFGLCYIDGKLFVHHCPKFSVFTDDNGIGRDRVDLIETTNPNPAPGFNDHIPSNMRLAMDGYLYVSTGDKGVYGCVAKKDGRRCEIHGGGVFRIRPDGTGLETYCTGTRNHLDVAINAEDEIFTYDNTDDGNGWWTRVTHMVDGGFYGYPWDYKPQRKYTLWMMADFGGGAPTGAMAYNEDALPPEYRGNLFLCEWGRKQLLRLPVHREGASYKIDLRDNFLTAGTKEFRPVGICTTPDGMGFYITDWNFGGWKQKAAAGRLLKVTHTGKSLAKAKPDWYLPAAMGQKFEAKTSELIDGLKHPAQSVRLVAQRRLVERNALPELAALLHDTSAPVYAKWSAIWTLDAIAGAEANPDIRKTLLELLADKDTSVRRQAARELGTREAQDATAELVKLLEDPDASVRFQAATALGRIGSGKAIAPLLQSLKQTDLFARYAAFTALNRIGHVDPKYWAKIAVGLTDGDPAIREGTLFAIRATFESGLVHALRELAADSGTAADARVAAIRALADIHRQPAAWDGKWWGTQPVKTPRPPGTVNWAGTRAVRDALAAALKDDNALIRRAATEGAIAAHDAELAPVLAELFRKDADVEIRRNIVKAAAATEKPGPLAAVVAGILEKPKENAELLSDAVLAAEKIGGPAMVEGLGKLLPADISADALTKVLAAVGSLKLAADVPQIAARLSHENAAVREAAVAALTGIGGSAATKALVPLLSNPNPEQRRVAVNALGALKSASAVAPLLTAFADPETRYEAMAALSGVVDPRAVDAYLTGMATKNAAVREGSRKALLALRAAAYPTIEAKLETGGLTPEVVGELQGIYAAKVPLTWTLLGPFPADAKMPFAFGESNRKAEYLAGEGKKVKWKAIKEEPNKDMVNVDLRKELRPDGECAAFARAELFSPAGGEIEIEGGFSGAGLTLWLNGAEIFNAPKGKVAVKVEAKPGVNELVARSHNTGGSWALKLAATAGRSGNLFAAAATKPLDLKKYEEYAVKTAGKAEHGKSLFLDLKGLGCAKCHKVGALGTAEVGPDLLGVGAKYNRAQLIESVLYPSKQILDGYQQTRIATSSGQTKVGIVRAETGDSVTLVDAEGKKEIIKKADIEERKTLDKSLMPEGLEKGLTLQDFADVIAFLESLKEKPAEKK